MKPIYLILFLSFCSCNITVKSSSDEEKEAKAAILKVIEIQETAWNQHELEGFMQGYWKNDSLKFYGSNGLTYGWDNILNNYKKNYPTEAESGTLNFRINDIAKIEDNSYHVMGEYHLTRKIGDAHGVFIIIFKKIDGKWKIVADMSC